MTHHAHTSIRGDITSDIMREKLQTEIRKLEAQLERLQGSAGEHRFALMDTYRTMIETRRTLLDEMQRIGARQQA